MDPLQMLLVLLALCMNSTLHSTANTNFLVETETKRLEKLLVETETKRLEKLLAEILFKDDKWVEGIKMIPFQRCQMNGRHDSFPVGSRRICLLGFQSLQIWWKKSSFHQGRMRGELWVWEVFQLCLKIASPSSSTGVAIQRSVHRRLLFRVLAERFRRGFLPIPRKWLVDCLLVVARSEEHDTFKV